MIRFLQFHENEKIINFAQTATGRVIIFLLACLLIPWGKALFVAPFLAAYFVWPKFRNAIMSLGGLALLYSMLNEKASKAFFYGGYKPSETFGNILTIGLACAFFGVLFYVFYRFVLSFEKLPWFIRKRPQIFLHILIWLCFIISWSLPGGPLEPRTRIKLFFWIVLAFLPFITWRLGYLLMTARRGKARKSRFQDHLFYLWPVFGGTNTPFGKGYDYLTRTVSNADEANARSHLAGLRLLILADIWLGVRWLLIEIAHGASVGLPQVSAAMRNYSAGSISHAQGWISLGLELVSDALYWAYFGHGVIGILRLFGYYAFRNMYKPFYSQTILEFWNRYYYYYKELLVEFFFYPTYLAFFKNNPKLRLFAATFAAAFLGNLYFHILRDIHILFPMGFEGAFERVAPRAMYSFLLSAGIYVSFLREKKRRGKTWETGTWLAKIHKARRISLVLFYFTVIHVWIAGDIQLNFFERTGFFFWLIGF